MKYWEVNKYKLSILKKLEDLKKLINSYCEIQAVEHFLIVLEPVFSFKLLLTSYLCICSLKNVCYDKK